MTIYTPEALAQLMQTAYDKLTALTEDVQDAEYQASIARAALATRRAEILVEFGADPKALGANEATREATLSSMLTIEREDLAGQEGFLVGCRNRLTLHQIEIEHLRAQLRIIEVVAVIVRRDTR